MSLLSELTLTKAGHLNSTSASHPVCVSPPELSDVWEVSNTDAFSLRRLCLMNPVVISRLTKTGPCGIFWPLNAFFVSHYGATVQPLVFSATLLPFYTLKIQQMHELMWAFWAWVSPLASLHWGNEKWGYIIYKLYLCCICGPFIQPERYQKVDEH